MLVAKNIELFLDLLFFIYLHFNIIFSVQTVNSAADYPFNAGGGSSVLQVVSDDMTAVTIVNSKRKAKEILEKNDAKETNKVSDMSACKRTNRRIKQSSEKSNCKILEQTTGKELVITSTDMKGALFDSLCIS